MLIQLMATRHLDAKVDSENILLPPPSASDADGEFFRPGSLRQQAALSALFAPGKFHQAYRHIFHHRRGENQRCPKPFARLVERGHPFSRRGLEKELPRTFNIESSESEHDSNFFSGLKTASTFNWNPLRGPPSVHPQTWISVVSEAWKNPTSADRDQGTFSWNSWTSSLKNLVFTTGFLKSTQTFLTPTRICRRSSSRAGAASGRIPAPEFSRHFAFGQRGFQRAASSQIGGFA